MNDDAPAEAAPVRQSELGEPDAAMWRKVVLRAVNEADADVEIELLRPLAWLTAQGAAVGAVIHVDLPELNTRGPARVLAMEQSPAIESGEGSVVTGRFRHLAENLLDVYVEGLNEPIGCTERHPFWSVTRGAWIPAADLLAGERLLASDGSHPRVVSVHFRGDSTPVYNLEVAVSHVYRVGQSGLLVHNNSFGDSPNKVLSQLQVKFDEMAEAYLLPKYREPDPNLKRGYTGSFKTGTVGNRSKPTFGQPIDLSKFDVDVWIESDILYKRFGSNLRADVEFRKLLSNTPVKWTPLFGPRGAVS